MAESRGLPRALVRWLPLSVFLASLCVTAFVGAPAKAAVPAAFRGVVKGPLPIPGAFRLPASNGYTLFVISVPPHAKLPGKVLVIASAKRNAAFYIAPATVTETSIQSDLGELGEISVTFQRSNRAATAPCGKRKIRFDSGEYEGRIDFHGEEGYTSVEATTVPGNIDYFLSEGCGEEFFESGPSDHAQGAALLVRNPALGPELSVRKSRLGAPATITASMREYSNGISIERVAGLRMPGKDFTFDRRLRTATVRPPAPFSGSAHFDLGKKAGQRWSGDLTVDLPGRTGVPLTGAALRATLRPSE